MASLFSPWSAVISGAAGLLGAGVDMLSTKSANKYNLQAQRETNEMNYKIAQENNSEQMRRQIAAQQFDVEQWNRNNAYNSFAAQMQRARDAGLNPQGIVSNTPSTQVTAPTPQTPITPTMQAPHKDPESFNLREIVQNWYSNIRSLFDMKKEMKQDVRDQEQHDQNMQEGAERIIGQKKQNAKTEEERRKAAAEATDMENAIERNQQRHQKDIEFVDKQIEKIDSDMDDARKAADRDQQRIDILSRAQDLNERLGESKIKVDNATAAQLYQSAKNLKEQLEGVKEENKIKSVNAWLANEMKEARENFKHDVSFNFRSYETMLLVEGAKQLIRENKDQDAVNDWIRQHAKLFGLGVEVTKGIMGTAVAAASMVPK